VRAKASTFALFSRTHSHTHTDFLENDQIEDHAQHGGCFLFRAERKEFVL